MTVIEPRAPVIETDRLTKRYGSARGIEDLDLVVDAGEVFGFLGPNGSGKSTTIRTLLDFQRPTSGSARVLGLDSTRDSVAIRRRVGYLPGDLHLFDRMTGADHLRWFDRARGGHDPALVSSLVARFEITLDRAVDQLSKGNRQKVGVLLAFAHRPDLVILDEPTSGLDPLMQAQFDDLVRETADDGRSVLLSSHSLDEVQRVADRVAIIREGRLEVTDTIGHLQDRAPRLLHLSFGRPVDSTAFAELDEVTTVAAAGNDLDLTVNGPIAPVLHLALTHDLVDLTARHADLDELFLTYYRGTPGGPSHDDDHLGADGPGRASAGEGHRS